MLTKLRKGPELASGRRYILWLILTSLILLPADGFAQCAMCRAVLESSGENSMAEGINDGIVYLMAIPYILVAFLIYVVYRKMKQRPA